jgi:hypothetical protein
VSVSTTELWQELKKEYSSEDITQHSVLQYLNVMVSRSSLCVPLPSLIIIYFNNATGSGADHPEEDERRGSVLLRNLYVQPFRAESWFGRTANYGQND